jgi:CRISPR-associated endonuclease/helicase Cas3
MTAAGFAAAASGRGNPPVPSLLLAKSPRGASRLTLIQHLQDTEQAAAELFRAGTRWARSYLRFFRLDPGQHGRFLLNLRVAALFHDIGKANEDFQAAMRASGFKAQSLRHEHLSALWLSETAVRTWLGAANGIDVDVVTAAVLSHHLKAGEDGDWMVLNPRHAPPTRLFFDDPQIAGAFRRIAEVAGRPPFAGTPPAGRYVDDAWTPAHTSLFANAGQFRKALRNDPERQKLALAVKAGLIVADSVSSGMFREGLPLTAWIDGVAHKAALAPDDIQRHVLDRRIEQIDKSHPNGRRFAWHAFQNGAAGLGRRGLLLAACGAGKTLAAWRWADAVSRREEIARVILLYPTRGTATEGFRDYVAHAPEGEAALVHGSSEYELAAMQANPPESLQGKQIVDETEARLFALGLWDKRYFSATVDQFLGFIEHAYRGMCLVPALADAAVIFDEIHSYDANMWNALITFLARFDVPTLCMTATLPPSRRNQITRHLTAYPSAADRAELQDLEEKEAHPRYRLAATTRDRAVATAVDAVKGGYRVLWVVNTVRRCQELAMLLATRLADGTEVIVYHSRFRLQDRQDRHRQTVDAFRAPEQGEPARAIAVTTQVCEMSLDLDADLLITEHAPISSLVQRFGRANRHLRRGPDFRATLLTYAPESNLPYDTRELKAASAFLADLLGRTGAGVSQRDLAEGLETHSPPQVDARGSTAFTEGGYFATPGALRDSDDGGAPAILDTDVAEYRRLVSARCATDGLVLNVPRKQSRPADGAGLPSWLLLADGGRYDPWLGFRVDDVPGPASASTPKGAGHE